MTRFFNKAAYSIANGASATTTATSTAWALTRKQKHIPIPAGETAYLWIEQDNSEPVVYATVVGTITQEVGQSGDDYTVTVLNRDVIASSSGAGVMPSFTGAVSVTSAVSASMAEGYDENEEGPFDIIVGVGQSNMVSSGGTSTITWIDEKNYHSKMWTQSVTIPNVGSTSPIRGEVKPIRALTDSATSRPYANMRPLYEASPTTSRYTGIVGGFAVKYIKANRNNGRRVLCLLLAAGNTGMNDGYWNAPGFPGAQAGNLLTIAIDTVNLLLARHPGNKVVAILDHQGEADSGFPASFQARKEAMFNYLRANINQADINDIPIIFGYLASTETAINSAMDDIISSQNVLNIGLADPITEGLTTSDGVHYIDTLRFGQLYYDQWALVMDATDPVQVQWDSPATTSTPLSITLHWLQETTGVPPSTYKIEGSDNGSTGWAVLQSGIANTTVTYQETGLTASQVRYYRITATSNGVDAPVSTVQSGSAGASVAPGAITIDSIVDGAAKVATITTSIDTTGSPPVTYQVQASLDGATNWFQVYDTSDSSTLSTDNVISLLFDGTNSMPNVTTPTTYYFQARAVNVESVAGPWSASSQHEVQSGATVPTGQWAKFRRNTGMSSTQPSDTPVSGGSVFRYWLNQAGDTSRYLDQSNSSLQFIREATRNTADCTAGVARFMYTRPLRGAADYWFQRDQTVVMQFYHSALPTGANEQLFACSAASGNRVGLRLDSSGGNTVLKIGAYNQTHPDTSMQCTINTVTGQTQAGTGYLWAALSYVLSTNTFTLYFGESQNPALFAVTDTTKYDFSAQADVDDLQFGVTNSTGYPYTKEISCIDLFDSALTQQQIENLVASAEYSIA